MISAESQLSRARRSLESGHLLFANDFFDEAGRGACLAAFHAALAFIIEHTEKRPKTHRSEFLRLSKDDPRIDPRFGIFLAKSFAYKMVADYDGPTPVSPEEAAAALSTAAGMIDAIERTILAAGRSAP